MDFFAELKKSPSIGHYTEQLAKGHSLLVEKLSPPAKACLTELAAESTGKSILIITGAGPEEFKLYNDLFFFAKLPIIEFPAWETLPFENVPPSPDIVGKRYEALNALASRSGPKIIVTTLQSCLQKVVARSIFGEQNFTLSQGQKMPFENVQKKLLSLGFERKNICCDKGEFAVRGGIIDLFPIITAEPFRLEFWGDEIDSIRAFDPASQKSTRLVPGIALCPAKELEFVTDSTTPLETLFSFLGSDLLVILDDLEALEDRYASLTSLGARSCRNFLGLGEFFTEIDPYQKISFTQSSIEALSEVNVKKDRALKFYSLSESPHEVTFEMFDRTFRAWRWQSTLEPLPSFFERECMLDSPPEAAELLDAFVSLHTKCEALFVVKGEAEETQFRTKLADHGLPQFATHFTLGYLSSGFAVADMHLLLFPMTELTGRVKIRREQQRVSYHFTPTDAFDVAPGEMVVHYHHGIGKFLGIEKRHNHQGIEQEFFLIEYQDKARLFVPLSQAHLISKYIGAAESLPKVHAIGSNRWRHQREATEKAILGFANDLLKVYAEREIKGGFVFPPDGPETLAFDEEFPYVETEDQLAAIREVKNDMCSKTAMDRLVCGDVGYGKTEVALRAAFKAVLDGKKQVAMLVPTTVLAIQHYESFRDRMESFGVHVALLSRFQKAGEVKKIIDGLKNGSVDIVIGTHRLVQPDVQFKDLGLIVIDEEQRFGVRAKEHLKRMKTGVDCLTLTATPIPRTLYLSLVGARPLSVINTPPQDRLPIKTIITEPDDHVIETALLRELNRDGQAYFIHNRVETIHEVESRLRKLLPKARIVVGHGQMDADEIDLVFHTFKKGDADILIATSIVENGIDIPNANTIIVDDADRFGISDLYQLRGRVGRWNRRAYAYFLISKRRILSELAKKRIEAIALAGGYGAGIKVAMRDLEMRGAGDILGLEQSGQVTQVGFHLYCKLLRRTIDSLQGKAPTWTLETRVEIPFDARLPEFYVNDVQLRMEIYQRLGDALSLGEIDAIWSELKDRFGAPPEPAQWLYHLSRLRLFASQRGYTLIKLDSLSCFYERKTGNQVSSNKVLAGRIKTPQELEEKISALIA
jgi:transcription-repair coupling factor (superfamily II helicase)